MKAASIHPVFYDPTRIRTKVVKYALVASGITLSLWLSLVAWGFFFRPELPALILPTPPQAVSAANALPSTFVPPAAAGQGSGLCLSAGQQQA